jgi:hypothetical protein
MAMRKTLLPLIVLSCSLPAVAQLGNVIHEVEPNHGPVAGGTRVVITGDFSIEPIVSPPCMGAFTEVFIGGNRAELVSFTTERVEVSTRAYTPGRFDVVVDRCGVKAVAENAFVHGNEVWERALLPVVYPQDVPGAFGSLWRTEVAGVNLSSGQSVTTDPHLPCTNPSVCTGVYGAGPFAPLFPLGLTGPGRLLYVSGFEVEPVALTLRVRDVSRAQESLGTELPVVWEDESFGPKEFFAIAEVPRSGLYRSKLRLYRMDVAEPASLVVRIGDNQNNVITERSIVLSGGRQENDFLIQPPYAELDLETLLGPSAGVRYVSVQTPGEGLYWGFISVTNNATQQITTVSP